MSLGHLCWLATAAYGIHIAEEYLLGWRDWVRSISAVYVSRGFFFAMNALALAVGMACAALADRLPMVALAFPALMLINATFFHVGAFVWTRGRFSPGLITATSLFYPMGIWCFKSAYDAGELTVARLAGSFVLGAIFMAVPLLMFKAIRNYRDNKKL